MSNKKDDRYANLPKSGELTLLFPIDFEGGTVERLNVRRPKMADEVRKAEALKDGRADEVAVMKLLGALIEKPFSFMEEMDPVDFQRLQEIYAGFLPKHMIAG